jgi:hypothetical protein
MFFDQATAIDIRIWRRRRRLDNNARQPSDAADPTADPRERMGQAARSRRARANRVLDPKKVKSPRSGGARASAVGAVSCAWHNGLDDSRAGHGLHSEVTRSAARTPPLAPMV